ncbi:Delta8-fatty-acid desaturase [Hondaea fermentalgiana]|uniref:Delta8-fatty-acid desaturase n=1 Tax=Hondaea fermentalgiana TaxID=2315210 RepID=A0A2R5GVS9_9STRA|nr:Delta8-fatty-acid desaturase [Hondaea fermentalgiana]|eukprot:GBG34675.1 Delta8-fatty-acid desaturase [Hondaea fermentalgiana]
MMVAIVAGAKRVSSPGQLGRPMLESESSAGEGAGAQRKWEGGMWRIRSKIEPQQNHGFSSRDGVKNGLGAYVLSLLVLFGGWMVALFGVAGSVRPGVGGVLSFAVTSLTSLLFVLSSILLYRSQVASVRWIADLMEDRVLRARKNWTCEPLRSLVEVGSWLHITFRMYTISQSPLVAAAAGAIAGAFCVVLGETLTLHCRKVSPPPPGAEVSDAVLTPHFASLVAAVALAGACWHAKESQDLGLALILATLTNVAFITAEQLLMLWKPTRWAADILHDRVVNLIYNWQHVTIRSGFETSFYLSSIFSCYCATESVPISVAVGTIAGIFVVLSSSYVGLGTPCAQRIDTSEKNNVRAPCRATHTFGAGFALFALVIFAWTFATLLYTVLVFSRSAVLAIVVAGFTGVALVCVAAMTSVSAAIHAIPDDAATNSDKREALCYSSNTTQTAVGRKRPALRSKWDTVCFTLSSLVTATAAAAEDDSDENEGEEPSACRGDASACHAHRLGRVKMDDVLRWSKDHGISPQENPLAPLATFARLAQNKPLVTPQALAEAKPAWILLEGFVFDISTFAALHPGGEDLLRDYAKRGADVSDQFAAFHHPATYARLFPLLVGRLDESVVVKAISQVSTDCTVESHKRATEQYRLLRAYLWAKGYFHGAESDRDAARAVARQHIFVLSLAMLAVCQIFLLQHHMSGEYLRDDPHADPTATLSTPRKYLQAGLAAATLGFFWQQVAFIAHDAMHNGVVNRTKEARPSSFWVPNNVLGWLHGSVLFGISSHMWNVEHSGHHAQTCRTGEDPQFNYLPMWAISLKEFSTRQWQEMRASAFFMPLITRVLVSVQHWTLLPLAMLVGRFNFYAINIVFAIRHRVYYDLAGMVLFWIYFTSLLSQLGSDVSLKIFFVLVSHWTVGVLHVQLLISHLGLESVSPEDEQRLGFFAHQLKTTRDIATSERWAFLHGGLERQIAHHLWPSLPRVRLDLVTPAVKEICHDTGIAFDEVPFFEAIRLCIVDFRDIAHEVWAGNIAI